MITIQRNIDEKRAAKVVYDRHGCHLHTMNNGFQWSGAAIYSLDVAKASIHVLQNYVDAMESKK